MVSSANQTLPVEYYFLEQIRNTPSAYLTPKELQIKNLMALTGASSLPTSGQAVSDIPIDFYVIEEISNTLPQYLTPEEAELKSLVADLRIENLPTSGLGITSLFAPLAQPIFGPFPVHPTPKPQLTLGTVGKPCLSCENKVSDLKDNLEECQRKLELNLEDKRRLEIQIDFLQAQPETEPPPVFEIKKSDFPWELILIVGGILILANGDKKN